MLGWAQEALGCPGTHSGPCSPLGLLVPLPLTAPLGWDPCQRQPQLSRKPLLTMPCLTIQSLRLFSLPPPIWVRKGHAEGGGKGRATGALAAFSNREK